MSDALTPRLYVALVHHPVVDSTGAEIASTTDELDIFDACRVTLVYPVRRLFVVQPTPSQQALVTRLLTHGRAADRPSDRGRFDHARLVDSLDAAIAAATEDANARPLVIATTAQQKMHFFSFSDLRNLVTAGTPTLLLIGKARGLAPSVFERADGILEPISGGTGFDHLPVRAATVVLLDRLVGIRAG